MIARRPGTLTHEEVVFVRCRNCGKQVDEDDFFDCCKNPDVERITRHVLRITEKLPIFDKK